MRNAAKCVLILKGDNNYDRHARMKRKGKQQGVVATKEKRGEENLLAGGPLVGDLLLGLAQILELPFCTENGLLRLNHKVSSW